MQYYFFNYESCRMNVVYCFPFFSLQSGLVNRKKWESVNLRARIALKGTAGNALQANDATRALGFNQRRIDEIYVFKLDEIDGKVVCRHREIFKFK